MCKLILIEDEPAALRRLRRLLMELRPDWQIVASADSVKNAIEAIGQNEFDLLICDIHLSDGLFFDILKKITIHKPIIFVTAYDEFAIRAFDLNSVHYLVKPIERSKLNEALDKFELRQMQVREDWSEILKNDSEAVSGHMVSRVGNRTELVRISDVAMVYTEQRITKVILKSGMERLIDLSLDQVMEQFSEKEFFRINRQWIVRKSAVRAFSNYSSHRILLQTQPEIDPQLIVSKDKTPTFKRWLTEP